MRKFLKILIHEKNSLGWGNCSLSASYETSSANHLVFTRSTFTALFVFTGWAWTMCTPRPRLFRNARPQCSQVIGGKFLAAVLSLTAVFTHFIRCTSRRYQNIARRSSFSGASAQPESTFALLSRSARAIREWAWGFFICPNYYKLRVGEQTDWQLRAPQIVALQINGKSDYFFQ